MCIRDSPQCLQQVLDDQTQDDQGVGVSPLCQTLLQALCQTLTFWKLQEHQIGLRFFTTSRHTMETVVPISTVIEVGLS